MALHDRILRGGGGADVVSATLWPLDFSKELSSRRCAFFGRHHPGAPRAPRSGSRARRRFLSRAGCERKRLGPRFSRVAVPRASRRAGRAAGATPSALRRWSCAAGVEARAAPPVADRGRQLRQGSAGRMQGRGRGQRRCCERGSEGVLVDRSGIFPAYPLRKLFILSIENCGRAKVPPPFPRRLLARPPSVWLCGRDFWGSPCYSLIILIQFRIKSLPLSNYKGRSLSQPFSSHSKSLPV